VFDLTGEFWDLFGGIPAHERLVVFLCGAGLGNEKYKQREEVKNFLKSLKSVDVVLGEDLLDKKKRGLRLNLLSRQVDKDLLTVELRLALFAQLTVLMPEGPGAFAELGTFSTFEQMRQKLYVFVDQQYHKNESYVARGPLSIVAKRNSMAVCYYPASNVSGVFHHLLYAVAFSKYLKFNRIPEAKISVARTWFNDLMAYTAIRISEPTDFSKISRITGFNRSTLGQAMKRLRADHKIIEFARDKKIITNGKVVTSPFWRPKTISSRRLSKLRARFYGV